MWKHVKAFVLGANTRIYLQEVQRQKISKRGKPLLILNHNVAFKKKNNIVICDVIFEAQLYLIQTVFPVCLRIDLHFHHHRVRTSHVAKHFWSLSVDLWCATRWNKQLSCPLQNRHVHIKLSSRSDAFTTRAESALPSWTLSQWNPRRAPPTKHWPIRGILSILSEIF